MPNKGELNETCKRETGRGKFHLSRSTSHTNTHKEEKVSMTQNEFFRTKAKCAEPVPIVSDITALSLATCDRNARHIS